MIAKKELRLSLTYCAEYMREKNIYTYIYNNYEYSKHFSEIMNGPHDKLDFVPDPSALTGAEEMMARR